MFTWIINFLKSEKQLLDRLRASSENTNYIKESLKPKFFHETLSKEDFWLYSDFDNKYYTKVDKLSDNFYDNEEFEDIYEINKRIKQCQKAIEAFECIKSFCYQKGHGGELFYQKWEMENHDCVERFNIIKQEHDELINNREESIARLKRIEVEEVYGGEEEYQEFLQEEEERKRYVKLMKNIEIDIIKIIHTNNGIYQKDVKQHFDPLVQGDILRTIKALETKGDLVRVKKKLISLELTQQGLSRLNNKDRTNGFK